MPRKGGLFDVAAVAAAIKLPVDQWPGNCHEVAVAVHAAGFTPGGVVRYGHYYGPVSRRSIFTAGRPFHRHGWIELADGLVIDPTRWVFQARKPYIWRGPGDDYDASGNRFRASIRAAHYRDYPTNAGDKTFSLTLTADAADVMASLAGEAYRCTALDGIIFVAQLTFDQLGWFANCPPKWFGGHAREVYEAIAASGPHNKALIPIDNWQAIVVDRRPPR